MKKTLSLILSLMLLLSFAAVAETDTSGWLCEEKTTLTVCTYDGVSQAFPTIGNHLRFWQWLEEYTNVHIEWEVHSNADYGTVKAAKLAAGSIDTDIICLDTSQANEAGMAGMLIDMTPYIDTCMPHTKRWVETENPMVLSGYVAPDGKMYGVGGTVSPDIGHIVYLYNTHFFEKMGFEWPETLDEFTEMLRAMKGVDLNGNGVDDEILLTGGSLGYGMDIIASSFGCEYYESSPMFAADENGKVYSEHITDETRDYWAYLNMLFEEGILDPGIATNSPDKMSQKIAQDCVAVFCYYSGFATSYGNLTSWGQEDPTACHYAIGTPLEGPNGDRYYVRRDRGAGGTGVSVGCKTPELAIKWLDALLCDPVVVKVRTCGWEGEHYYYDENGEMQLITNEEGMWSISDLGCGQIAMPHHQTYDQMMNSKKHLQWYMDQYNALLDPYMFIASSVVPNRPYSQAEQDLMDMCKSEVDTYYKEMRAKFITGDADIETEWDTYVDTMYGLGLQDWIDAMQMYYDRGLQ